MQPFATPEPGAISSSAAPSAAIQALDQRNADLNQRILRTGNAGQRRRLLQEKNQSFEIFAQDCGLSAALPDPAPDFPVLDLSAMEALLQREAELDALARIEPSRFSLTPWSGLLTALAILLITLSVLAVQTTRYTSQVHPVLRDQDILRLQIEQILVQAGDREAIRQISSLPELERRSRLLTQAVELMSTSPHLPPGLPQSVAERREVILLRAAQLRRKP